MVLKDSIYWDIFGGVWAFFKHHMETEEIDWAAAVDEAAGLGHKYENTPQFEFAKKLVLATMDEMERIGSEGTDA